jgi:thioesterase domain-containing protein
MEELVQALQETFAHEIPITRHLGITVASYNSESLILTAPLKQNINHKATAFAGSLNSLVTLAGWGLIWLMLKELDIAAKTVIQDSTTRYIRPVTRDFSARCHKPDASQIARFEKMLREKGKARLELHVAVYEGEAIAVSFIGRYVSFVDMSTNKR